MKRLGQEREATYVEKTPEDVYNEVSKDSEFSPEDIAKIGGVESQHGKYNKPLKGGSARGLFQFQPETAEDLIPGSSESLDDMNTQAKLMKEYLRKNKQKSIEDAYMYHQLGPGRGKKLIDAEGDADIKSVIPKSVIRANPSLYEGETVDDARKAIQKKLDKGAEDANLYKDPLGQFIKSKVDRAPASVKKKGK